jgi:hypothetical protein
MRNAIMLFLLLGMCLSVSAASSNKDIARNPVINYEQAWGPDAFGYLAWDSNQPGGPVVNWIDISAIGTVVTGLGDDNIVGPYNVGFPFRYYWYDVSEFYVGSNGYLRFSGGGQLSSPFTIIPSAVPPNDLVCIYTADFDPSSGGTVYYWSNNTDTLIVSFVGIPAWNTPVSNGSYDFQVILSMVDSSIVFNYGTLTGTFYNTSGMVGIENNAGDIGISCYANNLIPSNYAIKFYYPSIITYQVHDVGVTTVKNDNSGGFFLERNQDFQASATIQNTGNQNEGDFYVIAEVRSYPQNVLQFSDSVWIDTLVEGQILQVDFTETWAMPFAGDYILRVISDLPGDLVGSNDQLDVEFHVMDIPGEMYMDDGVGEQNWSWIGGNGGMGIYYVPPSYPVKVTEIRASLGAGTLPVLLQIIDDDGPNGEPGTLLTSVSVNATLANWYSVDISDSNVIINDGGVYAAWIMTGDGASGLDVDQTSIGSRQTWEYTGVWALFRNAETEDALLRISIESSLYPPQNLVAQADTGVIDLSWDAPATMNSEDNSSFLALSGYYIYKANNSGGPFLIIDSTDINTVTYSDANVIADSTYWFYVTANYDEGESQASNTVSATPYGVNSIPKINQIPKEFALYQNYPNPFNPTTKIKYDLPKATNVTIEIYNMLGQKIVTLVNSYKAAGSHSALLDASLLSSGVYLYRIQADKFSQVKKLVVMK